MQINHSVYKKEFGCWLSLLLLVLAIISPIYPYIMYCSGFADIENHEASPITNNEIDEPLSIKIMLAQTETNFIVHNLEPLQHPPNNNIQYILIPNIPTPLMEKEQQTTENTIKLCPYLLMEGESYDESYEESHVMKAVKGKSCFLGHYTSTPEDKDYSGIIQGKVKIQEKIKEIDQKIENVKLEKTNSWWMSITFGVCGASLAILSPTATVPFFIPLTLGIVLLVGSCCDYYRYYQKSNELDQLNTEKENLEHQLCGKPQTEVIT